VSQAGRDAMATKNRRNGIVSGGNADAPAATSVELAAAVARQRARNLALMLMATSAVLVVGGFLLLLWWLT
jgi:hypothetical protein